MIVAALCCRLNDRVRVIAETTRASEDIFDPNFRLIVDLQALGLDGLRLLLLLLERLLVDDVVQHFVVIVMFV